MANQVLKSEPVKGMTVEVDGDYTKVVYEGEGCGLLLHQAHLADAIIEKTFDDLLTEVGM